MKELNLKNLSEHVTNRYCWDEELKIYTDGEDGTEIGYLQDVYNHIGWEYSATICKDENFFIFLSNNETISWEDFSYSKEEAIEIAKSYGW
ncbi:MAG: hypothetical protein PHF52_08575 [Sulfurospirillaceae bacterium]|nr:hypothetical protein [Sulfurospirillaceae bacterium]